MSCDRPLRPHRALLHPLWLASLAVLVLNDHVLKGSGLLPAVVTGKLSDFAGLLVAPALLAALVGVRSSRGWWLAHAAVGVVFSAIQLSPEVAGFWSRAMAGLGVPWVIVCDPTDLVALPMLFIGARAFDRAMRHTVSSNLRRSAEWTATTVGLACCVATSPPEGFFFSNVLADVYLHNATDRDVVVRVRALSPSIDLDCDAVATDPGRLLRTTVFDAGEAWSLRPGANMAVLEHEGGSRECYAAWIDVDDHPPIVAFWRHGHPEQRWISGEGLERSGSGWIALEHDAAGRGTWDAAHGLVHVRSEGSAAAEAGCMPPSDADRLDWSTMPSGEWTLLDIRPGVDGCLELALGVGEPRELQAERNWYLCVPLEVFPFAPGDPIAIEPMHESSGGWIDGVRLREVSVREASRRGLPRELVASRGHGLPALFGLDTLFNPDPTCPWAVDPVCGTVTREAAVAISTPSSGVVWLRADDGPKTLQIGDGRVVDVKVAHASERAVLDPECALGSDSLGPDIEIVAALRGDQEEER